MQCTCGGNLVLKSGFSSKGKNKAYSFYSCDRFPKCKNSIKETEYKELKAKGVAELPVEYVKSAKSWVRENHKPYTPKHLVNKNRATLIDYRRLTDEQEYAITCIMGQGRPMIRINADAGTGKSTLAIQVAARIGPIPGEYTTGIIVTFGKKASMEVKEKLPFNWVGSTIHSIGYGACQAAYGVWDVNEYKTKDILRAEYGDPKEDNRQAQYGVVEKMVTLCKAHVLTDLNTEDEILEACNAYNLDLGQSPVESMIMTKTVLRVGNTLAGISKYGVDFDDQVYLPVRNKLRVAQYRYVGVDEAQDSSPARMMLALMISCGPFFIVGDRMQAIFAFTYADMKAMDRFAELMGERTQDCMLTVNWRCPSLVLELARILCPSITARPNAPRGAIHDIDDLQFLKIVKPGDLVLCRVNADLVHAAYELIKIGVGAVVLGRDIARNLKNIISKLGYTSEGYLPTKVFIQRLNEWYMAEQELLDAKKLRNPERLFQKLDDDYNCILALCGVEVVDNAVTSIGLPSVEHVLAKIDEMFGEETDKGFDPGRVVTLATIHKMKGGQCKRVFILRAAENHPHPMAETEEEIDSERCVLHVGVTRTGDGSNSPEQALFFVNGMPQWYIEKGGAALITVYEGALR